MTTPAQTNFSGPPGKPPDGGFDGSGLSPDEAERLAAEFTPSWEVEDAPPAAAHAAYGNGGYAPHPSDPPARNTSDARMVAPHAPPARVETHEPEVSVIIDRSITAAEMDAQRQVVATSRPAVVAAAPYVAPMPQRVAPVMRPPRGADDSLELTASSLRKSNKGLFIGLGVAVAAAAAVLLVHGAMSSSSDTPSSTAAPTATATAESARATAPSIPPPPPPAAVPQAAPAPPAPAAVPVNVAAASQAPQRAPASLHAQYHAAPAPPPAVHHAAAPKTPPKSAGGGIVRDNPF